MKIRVCLKFEALIFALRKSQKHNFACRTGLALKKKSKFYEECNAFPCKILFPENPFLKVGCDLN